MSWQANGCAAQSRDTQRSIYSPVTPLAHLPSSPLFRFRLLLFYKRWWNMDHKHRCCWWIEFPVGGFYRSNGRTVGQTVPRPVGTLSMPSIVKMIWISTWCYLSSACIWDLAPEWNWAEWWTTVCYVREWGSWLPLKSLRWVASRKTLGIEKWLQCYTGEWMWTS